MNITAQIQHEVLMRCFVDEISLVLESLNDPTAYQRHPLSQLANFSYRLVAAAAAIFALNQHDEGYGHMLYRQDVADVTLHSTIYDQPAAFSKDYPTLILPLVSFALRALHIEAPLDLFERLSRILQLHALPYFVQDPDLNIDAVVELTYRLVFDAIMEGRPLQAHEAARSLFHTFETAPGLDRNASVRFDDNMAPPDYKMRTSIAYLFQRAPAPMPTEIEPRLVRLRERLATLVEQGNIGPEIATIEAKMERVCLSLLNTGWE